MTALQTFSDDSSSEFDIETIELPAGNKKNTALCLSETLPFLVWSARKDRLSSLYNDRLSSLYKQKAVSFRLQASAFPAIGSSHESSMSPPLVCATVAHKSPADTRKALF